MSAKFYTLLTVTGAAKLASAAVQGIPLKITQMAVGDGGGTLPTPGAQQTALIGEVHRADLNMLYIDPQNSSQIIAELVIPETVGGWWIREVGLFDDTGALIAVGNCPESYKPQLAEGSGRTQTVRMVLITSSTENITLMIDPAVVLATRKYVDDMALELQVYVDDQMAAHLAAADPHPQYAPNASPVFTGTPKAPTAETGSNSTQLATTAFVQSALAGLIDGTPDTLDTLKEIAAAINDDPDFSATVDSKLALKAPLISPALTGTPTAPTAEAESNTLQIATTAFVQAALARLIDSSPAALDTLKELAEALGNDPNFATTMTNALAGKQPLDKTLSDLSGKTAAAIIQYLGLGTAATANVMTSRDDEAAGRVVLNGNAIALKSYRYNNAGATGSDFNDAPKNAVSFVYAAAANSPGITGSALDFSGVGGGYNVQIVADYQTGSRIKFRTYNGDKKSWNGWQDIYNTANKPGAADVDAVSATNGGIFKKNIAIIGDNSAITLQNATVAAAQFIISRSSTGINQWFVGRGTPGSDAVTLANYIAGGRITIAANGEINLVAAGGQAVTASARIIPSDYSNFDARYALTTTAYTKAQSDARYLQGMRLGAVVSSAWVAGGGDCPAGHVLTGGDFNDGGSYVRYKPLQRNINGSWVTVAG